jgi:hypothetical protein
MGCVVSVPISSDEADDMVVMIGNENCQGRGDLSGGIILFRGGECECQGFYGSSITGGCWAYYGRGHITH